jgi:hypothetical protein
LHFEQVKRYFRTSANLIRYIERTHAFEYSKTMNIYEALKDKIDIALGNSRWLLDQNRFDLDNHTKPYDLDAYTDFDQLYLFLLRILRPI